MLVVAPVASGYQRSHLQAMFDRGATARATAIARAMASYLDLKQRSLAVTAATAGMIETWDPEVLQPIFDAQYEASRNFDSIYLGTPDGVSVLFSPKVRADGTATHAGTNYSDREYFTELKRTRKPAWSRVLMGRQSKVPNVMLALPILHDDGSLRGFVTGGFRLDGLRSLVLASNSRSDTRIVIVDGDNQVIVDSLALFDEMTLAPPQTVYSAPCTETARTDIDDRNQEVRATCSPLTVGAQKWAVWLTTPVETLATHDISNRTITIQGILGFVSLAVLLSAIVALFASRELQSAVALLDTIGSPDKRVELGPPPWWSPRELVIIRQALSRMLNRLVYSDHYNRSLRESLESANRRMQPLAAAWNEIGELVEILDADGHILYVNPAAVTALGNDAEIGKRSNLWNDQRRNLLNARMNAGEVWSGEVVTNEDGNRRIYAATATPVIEEGELARIIVIRHDITDQRNAEAIATHSARLASVGTLAAGIAHEVNNPLTYINMHLETFREVMNEQGDSELEAAAAEAMSGVAHIARIIRGLLTLSRAQTPERLGGDRTTVKVREVIQQSLELARTTNRTNIPIEVEVPPDVEVLGHSSELVQVFMNLLVNALLALQENTTDGKVKIAVTQSSKRINRASTVRIQFIDNGVGISAANLNRIFDPFFTTRTVGKGTGLGLAVCRSIIEAHQGNITVSSVVGQGTTFTVELPSSREAVTASAQTPTQSGIRILVVDDEPLVARSIARSLRGHEVTVAIGGEEALATLAVSSFDLILSDVLMGDMDGPSFFTEATRRDPSLASRFTFMTGAPRGSTVRRALDNTQRPVLAKPLVRSDLKRWIENALPNEGRGDSPPA